MEIRSFPFELDSRLARSFFHFISFSFFSLPLPLNPVDDGEEEMEKFQVSQSEELFRHRGCEEKKGRRSGRWRRGRKLRISKFQLIAYTQTKKQRNKKRSEMKFIFLARISFDDIYVRRERSEIFSISQKIRLRQRRRRRRTLPDGEGEVKSRECVMLAHMEGPAGKKGKEFFRAGICKASSNNKYLDKNFSNIRRKTHDEEERGEMMGCAAAAGVDERTLSERESREFRIFLVGWWNECVGEERK